MSWVSDDGGGFDPTVVGWVRAQFPGWRVLCLRPSPTGLPGGLFARRQYTVPATYTQAGLATMVWASSGRELAEALAYQEDLHMGMHVLAGAGVNPACFTVSDAEAAHRRGSSPQGTLPTGGDAS